MRKRLVCFRRTVHFFLSLERVALFVVSVHQFACKTQIHISLAAFARKLYQPTDRKGLTSLGTHFHRNLIVGAAYASCFTFEHRHKVVDRLIEHFHRVLTGLLLNFVKSAVDDFLGSTLLAVLHNLIDDLGDHLAANGIASFRYDDRGVGASEGNFAESDTYVFADDARSAVEFVKSLPQTGNVGILGHSEGGTIAFMLGADGVPDFIVSLAGMAISGKETLLMQNRHSLDRTPLSAVDKENSLKLLGLLFDAFIEQKRNNDIRPVDVDSIVAASGVTVNPQILASLKMNIKMRNTWIDGFLNLDPRNFLSDIKCPVLALNGDKDIQVNAVSNLSAVKESVKNAQVKSYPGLNHMFQHCKTGEVNEYGEIRETMSEEVIDDIVAFILSLK